MLNPNSKRNNAIKGGPEPSEKEIHEILGSKREDRFSDPFFDLVQNSSLVCFSCLLASGISVRPRGTCEKCQKIAGCWECAVYGSRTPISSTPGSSSPEWPGLDNKTSQPWSVATCPCTTSWSAYFRLLTLFWLKKTRQRTRSSVTGARCVRPWLTRDIVQTGSFRRWWAMWRGNWRSGTINSALSTPGYLLALLRELSQCPRALI